MSKGGWNIAEKRQYEAWLKEKQAIINTNPLRRETAEQQEESVRKAKADFVYFCQRYFTHLASSDFGWFHKDAAAKIIETPDILAVLEWPREHAKSILADVMLPLFLKAKGEITGMMIASANENKAATLLGDIQAELVVV